MTKMKRFVMKDPNDWGYPITDTDTGKVYSCASNIWMKELCTDINKIVDENEQLKKEYKKLKHRHGLLHDECLEEEIKIDNLKQWKKEVFDLIDKKIKEADECFEQTYDSWYQGQIDALKELKKELQE